MSPHYLQASIASNDKSALFYCCSFACDESLFFLAAFMIFFLFFFFVFVFQQFASGMCLSYLGFMKLLGSVHSCLSNSGSFGPLFLLILSPPFSHSSSSINLYPYVYTWYSTDLRGTVHCFSIFFLCSSNKIIFVDLQVYCIFFLPSRIESAVESLLNNFVPSCNISLLKFSIHSLSPHFPLIL